MITKGRAISNGFLRHELTVPCHGRARTATLWPLLMKRLCALVVLFVCCAVHAQSEGILFLHLRMTNGQLVLVEQKKTPGVLKRARGAEPTRGVQVELQSMNGNTLCSQTIADPTTRRVEFPDPNEPGKLRVREIILTNAEFTIRVPFHPQARAAVLSRRVSTNGAKAVNAIASARVELGRVALKPEDAR